MIMPTIATLAAATVALTATFCVADGEKNREKNSVSQAFELRMAGKVARAKDLLTEAVAKNRKDAAAHFELARVHFYTMKLDRALEDVEEAVTLRPDNARYHFLKGVIAEYNAIVKFHSPKTRGDGLKQMKKALESFRRTVELDPKDHEARLNLINLYLKNPAEAGGSRSEAEKQTKKLKALDATAGVKARCKMLGRQALQQQRDLWEKAIAKQANSPTAHEGLGRVCLRLDDTDKAVVHLDKALKLDPHRSVILLHLARHYVMDKQPDKAELTIERYLNFKPAPPVPLRAYGTFVAARIHKMQQRDERADDLLAQAMKLDPHLWQTFGEPPEVLFTAP